MERTNCLICNGLTDGAGAVISPFLSKYCAIGETKTEIRYCRACDFAFFKRRLTDAEASRLYSNYRGREYNEARVGAESSYARHIEIFEDRLSLDYTTRIRDHLDLLDVYPEIGDFRDILDFGGNGEIPGRVFRNAKIWVDDLSAGSTDHKDRKHDLIFASNVFEHVSDPIPLLQSLATRMHAEGVLFIDVPGPSQASLSEGLLWQRKHGGELYEMHEHINHFSKRSLALLVRAAGLIPVFEFRPRHTAQSLLAVFPGSDIEKRLMPHRETRTVLYEAKIARAEARSASEWVWVASEASAERVMKTLSDKVDTISVRSSDLVKSNEVLENIYRSTSWKITAPLRALKTMVSRMIGSR